MMLHRTTAILRLFGLFLMAQNTVAFSSLKHPPFLTSPRLTSRLASTIVQDDFFTTTKNYETSSTHAITPTTTSATTTTNKRTVRQRLQHVSHTITSVLGVDQTRIASLGASFALSYSFISNLNGALSLSTAWYLTCTRTGLSPLYHWPELLKSYGMLWGILQVLKPVRIVMAVAGAKASTRLLQHLQQHYQCSWRVACVVHYLLGMVAAVPVAALGIWTASGCAGVPVWQTV